MMKLILADNREIEVETFQIFNEKEKDDIFIFIKSSSISNLEEGLDLIKNNTSSISIVWNDEETNKEYTDVYTDFSYTNASINITNGRKIFEARLCKDKK